jgi:hypothetical protein
MGRRRSRTNALDEAEGALQRDDIPGAWSHATVVVAIARRAFVPATEAPWIEAERATLRTMLGACAAVSHRRQRRE